MENSRGRGNDRGVGYGAVQRGDVEHDADHVKPDSEEKLCHRCNNSQQVNFDTKT